jgi:hypothetical protein
MKRILSGMPRNVSHEREMEIISELEQLPDPWALAHNILLPDKFRNNAPDETDVIVIGPPGVYSLEIKYWRGEIFGAWQDAYIYRRQRSNSIPESWPNPIKIATNKNSILFSTLRDKLFIPSGRKMHFSVTPGVIFPSRKVSTVNISVPQFEINFPLLQQGELVSFFLRQGQKQEQLGKSQRPSRLKDPEIDEIYEFIRGQPVKQHSLEIVAGPYVLERKLRETEAYESFLAYNKLLPSQVHLVKKLKIDSYLGDIQYQEILERLLREAWALNELHGHPNIVQIVNPFQHAGETYVAYEWVEGPNLWDRIDADEGYDPADLLRHSVIPIIDAIRVAHLKGIMHRAITPEVIILTADGVAKIADFALARGFVQQSRSNMTNLAETPYAAPEVKTDKYSYGVDIYSLGAVCYEVVTGQAPPSARKRLTAGSELPFEPNHFYKDRFPPVEKQLRSVINQAMDLAPGRRYENLGLMMRDLEKAMNLP